MALIPSLSGYIFTEKLGRGSYSTVYKAYRNQAASREVVAVKCVNKSSLTKSSVEHIITEISILKKVKHENIVELIDFQWDSCYIYLILEYCCGGDLSNFIRTKKRLSESVAQKFLQQLGSALQVLRSHNIAHMDLKPQNILLSSRSNPVLKLGDFGLSQYLQTDEEAHSFRGSPLYMAPEILLKHQYDARVDLWSVGIILYECLFGQAPFTSQSFAELAEKIKSTKEIDIPFGAQVSDKCRELILGLLRRNPNKRLTFEEFFNHPFIDMKHMPTPESYAKGVNLVQEAVKADAEGKLDVAIKFYSEALEFLVPHIQNESNRVRKKELRKKLLEYVSRAEELKTMTKNEVSKTPESPKPQQLQNSVTLDDLIASKKNFDKAIFFAHQAEALSNDGCYDEAGHFYQQALGIMVPAVSEEPSGSTKELLYTEVSKWMQKAEDLKAFQSILKQEKKLERMNSLSDTVHFDKAAGKIDSNCHVQ